MYTGEKRNEQVFESFDAFHRWINQMGYDAVYLIGEGWNVNTCADFCNLERKVTMSYCGSFIEIYSSDTTMQVFRHAFVSATRFTDVCGLDTLEIKIK